jgi:hypothetical protein
VIFVVIHPLLSTLSSSSCWLVQDDDGNDGNVGSSGVMEQSQSSHSPKVVVFITIVAVEFLSICLNFCHCHHHLAGCSKMMMAMTTINVMSQRQSSSGRCVGSLRRAAVVVKLTCCLPIKCRSFPGFS